jgi:lipoate-protein ligase A
VFDELRVCADLEPRSAALNMAVDEALLESAHVPAIRFYGWRQPALSFGYFGRFAEVATETERDLVRRWTGGGVVFHGKDLTYSVVIPADHVFFRQSSLKIYFDLHDALRRALRADGVEADLADLVTAKTSEHCFANAVRADVISQGRKIAGAAHRRSRHGLLHQGSIQHENLPPDFAAHFVSALSDRCQTLDLAPRILERAKEIAETRYGTRQWLERC